MGDAGRRRGDLEDAGPYRLLDAIYGGAELFFAVGSDFKVEWLVRGAVAHLLVPSLGRDAGAGCDLNLRHDWISKLGLRCLYYLVNDCYLVEGGSLGQNSTVFAMIDVNICCRSKCSKSDGRSVCLSRKQRSPQALPTLRIYFRFRRCKFLLKSRDCFVDSRCNRSRCCLCCCVCGRGFWLR